jgi:hypothetical protein
MENLITWGPIRQPPFEIDEAFLRAGGPTNKKLIWCGLMLLFPFFFSKIFLGILFRKGVV